MLKLNKNVDIDKLKKIGLYPKYSENTGKIIRFESKTKIVGEFDKKRFKTIFFKKGSNYVFDEKCDYDLGKKYIPNVDIIYELAKADLIRKV